MYLTQDIIGAGSGIVYGRKGDKIEVIRKELDLCFVNNQGNRFFVRYEKLSEEKVNPSPEAIKESTGKVQRSRKGKR
jgi:hypothetical protein